MAGKDFKVQKKAKDQQRLSVFQPAFRWGGNNNNANSSSSSSSGSSSKVEAKKNDRPEVIRNDRLDRTKGGRGVDDQVRRNDNRLAIKEDPEDRMARDAKRMTTFQPIFGSLFSSKPSKGKSPEPSQLPQAQRPLANGPSSQQQTKNQAATAPRYGSANGAPGSGRAGRSGPGHQNGGLRIETQDNLGSNSRRDEAAANSSGRNGRGGLAPVPEGYSPRPRSPLQRNPAFTIPDDEARPLGISNAYGTGRREKDKANVLSNVPANSTALGSIGNVKNGQDRGLGSVPSSGRVKTRDDSPLRIPKTSGIDHGYTQGVDSQRDDRGTAKQLRLGETPVRRPVESALEPQMDSRSQQQSGSTAREDGKLAQQPKGRSQNVPQLIVTDASDSPFTGASGRPDRPSKGQQNIVSSTNASSFQPFNPVRETSGYVLPGSSSSPASNSAGRLPLRSPLDRIALSTPSNSTHIPRDVSPGDVPEESRRAASSKQVLPEAAASKPSLSVFPKQQPLTKYPTAGTELQASKPKSFDPLRPSVGRVENEKTSQVSKTVPHTPKETADQSTR